ncbi:MAG: O-Antigen ligase [Planctomycetota bacterium]
MDADASNPATANAGDVEQTVRDSSRIDWSTLHLWGVMLGIGMQPISTAAGNIGFGIAAAVTVPRVIALLPDWRTLLRQGWMLCLLAWLAWSWITLLWSPDAAFGVTQFRATRVLLWIPVLWPLRARWSHLVAAILIGTTIMALIQASQMTLGKPRSHFGLGAGLTTPTQTGLWAAVALSFWLILVVSSTLAHATMLLVPTMIGGLSLVWSATRASIIGLMVELLLANLVLALTSRGWLRRALVRCVVGLAILGGAWVFAGNTLQAKVEQAVKETKATVQGNVTATAEVRLAMWKMSLAGWKRAPIAGVGMGGIPSIAATTAVTNPQLDMRTVTMIHSTYIQILTETGLIGLGLFAAFMTLLFRDVLRGLRGQPLLVASFGALVVWFVAAAFDGYHQSGGFLSVGAILIPLALSATTERPTA